jgi:hypothetical protein
MGAARRDLGGQAKADGGLDHAAMVEEVFGAS